MKQKVYCKDCKYLYTPSYPYSLMLGMRCEYEIFTENKEASKVIGEKVGKFESISYREANKDNNCPYFKKKGFWDNFLK